MPGVNVYPEKAQRAVPKVGTALLSILMRPTAFTIPQFSARCCGRTGLLDSDVEQTVVLHYANKNGIKLS